MKYRVAYATGSRADYGIVRNYLKLLNDDNEILLDILVTGSLIEEKFGNSYKLIENDRFNIPYKVPMYLDSSSNSKIIHSMSIALDEFGSYFEDNKYDLLIILGDRYEILSVSLAAAMNRIPILHIHGGEITLGNYDEFIRHSITKMAHYHFTSTEEYRRRVIQLGENPQNVFNIGAMGSENCKFIDETNVPLSIKKLEKKEYFVVLFHPETLTGKDPQQQMQILNEAISLYIDKYKFVFIGSNADTGSQGIREEVKEYVEDHENAIYYENLHPDAYHYLIKNSIALIGNSSSGIIEVPTLGAYTINIGDRQKGRARGNSILDIKCEKMEIVSTINKVLNSKQYEEMDNPYYKDDSSKNAYSLTKRLLKNKKLIKEFYDINL